MCPHIRYNFFFFGSISTSRRTKLLIDPPLNADYCEYPPQTVSVWGSGGRIEMTAAKFMALQAAVQPDWYHSMADGETWQSNATRKRVRKSVDRTLAHLDECLLMHHKSQVRVTQLSFFLFFFLQL